MLLQSGTECMQRYPQKYEVLQTIHFWHLHAFGCSWAGTGQFVSSSDYNVCSKNQAGHLTDCGTKVEKAGHQTHLSMLHHVRYRSVGFGQRDGVRVQGGGMGVGGPVKSGRAGPPMVPGEPGAWFCDCKKTPTFSVHMLHICPDVTRPKECSPALQKGRKLP